MKTTYEKATETVKALFRERFIASDAYVRR